MWYDVLIASFKGKLNAPVYFLLIDGTFNFLFCSDAEERKLSSFNMRKVKCVTGRAIRIILL